MVCLMGGRGGGWSKYVFNSIKKIKVIRITEENTAYRHKETDTSDRTHCQKCFISQNIIKRYIAKHGNLPTPKKQEDFTGSALNLS